MKTSRVGRMIQILTTLQSGQRCRVNDLAEMFGMSRRMVFRDLEELRKIGVPCRFDGKARCYTMDSGFFLPAPNLSEQEALGLLLLARKARNHLHFPFMESALRAALKIENNLPEKIKRYCGAALQNISIKTSPQERTGSLDQIFSRLLKAILKKQIVNVRYYLPREKKSITTDLSPSHLMYDDQTWCVLGQSSTHKAIRTFRLNQIKGLKVLDKCFIEDKKFDVSEYLSRAWSMVPEGRLYNIKLRFLPEVARSVAEVQWHSTQTVSFEEDGSAIVQFRVDGLNEIIWWILSHGDKVQVLAPRVLRQRIVEVARNTVRQNEQLSPV